MISPSKYAALLRAFACGAVLVVATAAAPLPAGPIVLARTGSDALVLWDASSEMISLIANKMPADAMMRKLESDAVVILGDRAKAVASGTKTLTVQVIYQRSGAISPAYQTATFLGIEHLVAVKAPLPAAATRGDAWAEDVRNGKTPDELTVTVSGKLPPEVH
jgi:hypothetical protein